MAAVRYRITTLGCRVNHAEARELESVLLARGLKPVASGQWADLEVVHTCSVTGTAAAKSRQTIRRVSRRRALSGCTMNFRHDAIPQSPKVIVTGCYASTDPQEASRLAGGPHRVLPADGPGGTLAARFARQVDQWLGRCRTHSTVRTAPGACCPQSATGLPPRWPHGAARHVRAELKVQDGCDAHCTFCIIPRLRSTLRSKSVRDAVTETRRLVDLGHREIVLTGIFLGAYGHRTALRHRQGEPESARLADLLDAVARVPGLLRVRLSSLEPGDVDEPLLDAMIANRPTVVPHLHLPLQSGSDRVLRRMNRQYRVGDYLEMVDRVSAALTTDGLPPAITTDVICGFPGETGPEFERTVAVARRVGFLHMHVFPFNPRPGTAAARWRDRFLPPPEVRRRVRRLLDLERHPRHGLSIRYRRRLLGRTVRLIVEQPGSGVVAGRCDHYALVHVPCDRPRGTVVTARVCDVTADRTIGRPVGATIPLPVVQ